MFGAERRLIWLSIRKALDLQPDPSVAPLFSGCWLFMRYPEIALRSMGLTCRQFKANGHSVGIDASVYFGR
jgi:hypothetical protein